MESKEFIALISSVAKKHGFHRAFGGWFMDFSECLIVLNLQKSNYGNFFYINIKIYVQGIFGKTYVRSKNLVTRDTGDVFRREPNGFEGALNLDSEMSFDERKRMLETLFTGFLVPFANGAGTRNGLLKLAEEGEILLLPAVKLELQKVA